jgi:small subunit ribosomal protein S24e
MSYILFGAYNITVTERGLECDEWLPIVGNIDALDDIQRLKYLMEACMLRVFEGITYARHRQQVQQRFPAPTAQRRDEQKEDESDDDDDDSKKDLSLSLKEIQELDTFTQGLVRIINRYSDERVATQSRHNSRPATPMDSPSFGQSRLPSFGGRSGSSTPWNLSRPGTPMGRPSPLSRKW